MCNFSTFKAVAGQIMWPVYSLGNTSMANYSGFMNFINNMWNHYSGITGGPNTTGCAWWVNRVDLWTDQIIGPPPITNTYQLALKTAKIQFAQEMHLQCACPGPVPTITNPNIQNNKQWTEKFKGSIFDSKD